MVLFDYFEDVANGIQFLIALGSVIGMLGFILGLTFFIFGSSRLRLKMLGVMITSIILISICGVHTGTKYFHIY
ncbi:MAG: hypothetical protein EU532_12840 [Promethearchaeota archaeon]|nr:MAG: hypothetical protein EU532_12840 [Candidatus Lokiarchaeota archaeon]